MSKGLGKLQREILETLEDARQWSESDAGLGYRGFRQGFTGRLGTIPHIYISHGQKFMLGEGVFDLRASLLYLAALHGAIEYTEVKPAFKVSFSRAARSLRERGLIEGRIEHRQLRFVNLKC